MPLNNAAKKKGRRSKVKIEPVMKEFWIRYYYIGSPSDEVQVIFTSHLGQW